MRLLSAVLLASLVSGAAFGQAYIISTLAGGALPVNIPGTSASLYGPQAVAVDKGGNLFSWIKATFCDWTSQPIS